MRRPVRVVVAVLVTSVAAAFFVVPIDLLPDVDPKAGAVPLDLVIHVGLSAWVMMVWSWAWPGVSPWVLLALGIAFAGAAELSQALPFVERSPRLQDFGYNLIGVGLGVGAAALLRIALKR